MKNLTKLILCGNGFRGKIPKELGQLPSLRILDLSHNSELQGIEEGLNFPHGSPKLEIFVLRNNPGLKMPFKDLVSAFAPKNSEQNPSPLRVLDISYCHFTGEIPRMIWTLSSLIELNLKHNRISGTIPAVLDDLLFLSYADFSENPKLEGPIPNNFVLLQSLRVFDISNNPLMRAPIGSINQTSGIIQKFMRIDPNSRIKGDNYSCPLVKLHSNNGRILLDPSYYNKKFCVCDDGYFGYLGHCKRCIPGANCLSKTLQSIDPKISLDLQKGYWPSPSPDNVLHLIRCPGRLDFAGADLACNPGGQCKCWVNTSTPDLRTVCDKSCICHSGNTDRVCSKCEKNYFKNGYLCKECTNPYLSYYIVIPLVIIFLLALWGLTKFCSEHIKVKFWIAGIEFIILLTLRAFEVISGWIFEVSVVVVMFFVAGIMKNTRGIVTILVFHFQVLDAIISDTGTPFPQFIYIIQHYMSSIFNLNFLGISCSIHILSTPLGKYLVVFLFPLGCLLSIWIYYGIRWMHTTLILCRNEERAEPQQSGLEQVKFQCLKVSITCLILTYFPVMKHTLAVISPCDNDDDSASFFMRHTPWIRCDTSEPTYETLQVLGWIAIIIYGACEPFALWGLLRWWNQSPENQKKDFDSWLGSIYLPYTDKVKAYFEVIKLFRKLLIAFLITFIPNTCSIQTFTIALVLMMAVIYQIKVEPYAENEGGNFGNVLETLSLIALQQSVILLRFASYDSQMSEGMIWTVVAVNAVVLIAFMVALLSVLINVCSANSDERRPLLQGADCSVPS